MKNNYPLQLLTCITYREDVKNVEKIFEQFGVVEHSVLMGKGTAQSMLGDLFGFGIIDRDIVCAIVNLKMSEDIIEALDQKFNFAKTDTGICFCIPVSAISSDLISQLNLNGGVQND